MEDITKGCLKCRGPEKNVHVTNNPTLTQERAIRIIIGNWIRNSLMEIGIRRVELEINLLSCYYLDHHIYVIDGYSIIKEMLDLIRPKAKAKIWKIKYKLRDARSIACEVEISEILQDIEVMQNDTLAEGKSHQDFAIDHLNDLAAA